MCSRQNEWFVTMTDKLITSLPKRDHISLAPLRNQTKRISLDKYQNLVAVSVCNYCTWKLVNIIKFTDFQDYGTPWRHRSWPTIFFHHIRRRQFFRGMIFCSLLPFHSIHFHHKHKLITLCVSASSIRDPAMYGRAVYRNSCFWMWHFGALVPI